MVGPEVERTPDPDVVALGEAQVRRVLDQLDRGELAAHGLRGAVGRGVVDDDHVSGPGSAGGERAQARERVVTAVPGEDDGGDHGGTSDRNRRR